MSFDTQPQIPSVPGEPTWEVARLWPNQGFWREADFLDMHTNRMAELVNGNLEVLPMPSWLHQLIVVFFLDSIKAHLRSKGIGGVVLLAPLPVRLFSGTIREPDVLYVTEENIPSEGTQYPDRVDFVCEVVSEGVEARLRDYEHKRVDYAKAGVAEYWIVDPQEQSILVLGLKDNEYEPLGKFSSSEIAQGRFFDGFSIAVDDVMALAKKKPN